jgi:hypothetical protein
MNLIETGLGVVWTGLIWLRDEWWALVNMVVNLGVSQNFGKFLSS